MPNATCSSRPGVQGPSRRHDVAIVAALLGSLLCLGPVPAADSGPAGPTLRVPFSESRPVIDGKLDEPCWKDAARTGTLQITAGKPGKSATEALILRNARGLFVGLQCAGRLAENGGEKSGESADARSLPTCSSTPTLIATRVT